MQAGYPEFYWKLVGGKLPLYERHLRSLKAYGFSAPLCSWIRSRLEWTIENMTAKNPDGVLHILIEDDDNVTIVAEPAPELPSDETALGLKWLVYGDTLVPQGEVIDATGTLVRDLAKTLGFTVLVDADTEVDGEVTESFFVSDTFGVTLCDECGGVVSTKMCECFDKLWNASSPKFL